MLKVNTARIAEFTWSSPEGEIIGALCSCTSASPKHTDNALAIHDAGTYFISESAPSLAEFQAAIDAAVAGDDSKLAYVIQLERFTDGESALNFGDLLLRIRQRVDAISFARVLATLPPPVQNDAKGCMNAAEGTRRAYERYNEY